MKYDYSQKFSVELIPYTSGLLGPTYRMRGFGMCLQGLVRRKTVSASARVQRLYPRGVSRDHAVTAPPTDRRFN